LLKESQAVIGYEIGKIVLVIVEAVFNQLAVEVDGVVVER